MTEPGELSGPIVGGRARLDPDQTRRKLLEVRQHACSREPLLQYRRAGIIQPVQLKDRLRYVQSDHANACHGSSPPSERSRLNPTPSPLESRPRHHLQTSAISIKPGSIKEACVSKKVVVGDVFLIPL